MKVKLFSLMRIFIPLFMMLASPLSIYALDSFSKKTEEPVQAKLIAEESTIQPGRPFWVGVELNMAEGWDTYWVNPGDAGFPTKVHWHLPDGYQAGPLQWPFPERFTSQSLVGFGYTHHVLLLTQITPPKNVAAGEKISLSADVSWLACKEQCIPGNARISLQLPVDSKDPQADTSVAALFTKAREQLPITLSEEGAFTLATRAEEIVLNFKLDPNVHGDVAEALFIPEHNEVIDHAAPQNLEKDSQGFTLKVKRSHPDQTLPSQVKGVLLVSEKGSAFKKAFQIDSSLAPSSASSEGASHATSEGKISVGIALIFAFFGGLILNVMPCVLPVIALKILGFAKIAHQKRSEILKHGGVFGLGVLISFWVLSGILLILRAYGQGIGWGFQLQEPVFVAILAAILFVLGLSLFGVFELGTSLISLGNKTSTASSPMTSSFMSGILATLVATPCTGPLLGPALGFAMTLPPLTALSIFTMMGAGMAFPYLLFSAFPSLIRFLPKPGNWMIVFKQLMGFLMMGTVVWLIWVFSAQTAQIAVFLLLASLLVIAIGAWIFGEWAAPTRRKVTRLTATGIAFMIFLIGGAGAIHAAKQEATAELASSSAQEEDGQWMAYSPEKVAALRAEGKSVFVDFTAKWCLICQANKVVLHSSEVSKAFREKGVVTMTADWTKRDAVISDQLQKLGRSGVPVYVLYPSDSNQSPFILPQTLTATVVADYLNKLNSTTVYAD